jgi:phage terminase large subunit-like protein
VTRIASFGVSRSDARQALTETANAFPRFKQRLARHNDPAQAPFFEEDSEFDIRNHVRAVQLPANQRDSRGLDRYVRDLRDPLFGG